MEELGGFVDSCSALFLNTSDKIRVDHPGEPSSAEWRYYGNMQTSGSYDYGLALRHIFLEAKKIKGTNDYDFTRGEPNEIDLCSNNIRDPNERYCAVFPGISNPKLYSSKGIEIPANSEGYTYQINDTGFYTFSFNTIVNPEQAPISNLTVRIKEEGAVWTEGDGRTLLNNIDARPIDGHPHVISRFLTPGTYRLLISLQDNWNFYSCHGLPGFEGMESESACYNCCLGNPFVDGQFDNNCEACQANP